MFLEQFVVLPIQEQFVLDDPFEPQAGVGQAGHDGNFHELSKGL